jgi:uncharacterized protein with FMN-binding domain
MHRAIPAILVTAAAFVVVWQFEPTQALPPVAAPSTSTGMAEPGAEAVLGSQESTRWGPVQVRAVFSGGAITDIEVVQAPDDGPTNRALPTLRAEALRVQNASIDTVSGATVTSEAYARSLQAAIDARGA